MAEKDFPVISECLQHPLPDLPAGLVRTAVDELLGKVQHRLVVFGSPSPPGDVSQ